MSRLATGIGLALALAVAAPLAAAADPVDNAAVARRVCAQIGLNTSEAPFANCVASLTQSMTGIDVARTDRTQVARNVEPSLTRTERACVEAGVPRGTRQYQSCVGNLQAAMFDYANPGAR